MSNADILSKQNVLTTMLLHNRQRIEEFAGQETLIACGSPRGMTSLVAYTLYEAGLFIGARIGSKNYEDRDMRAAMPRVSEEAKAVRLDRHAPFLNLVDERNAAHQRWGFKIPYATLYVDQLSVLLRNPVFVVCIRNPAAVARSISEKRPDKDFDLASLLEKSARPLRAIENLLTSDGHGLIIIDMDEVRRQPGVFLREFTGLLKLPGDLERLERDISTPGYKPPSQSRPGTSIIRQGPGPG